MDNYIENCIWFCCLCTCSTLFIVQMQVVFSSSLGICITMHKSSRNSSFADAHSVYNIHSDKKKTVQSHWGPSEWFFRCTLHICVICDLGTCNVLHFSIPFICFDMHLPGKLQPKRLPCRLEVTFKSAYIFHTH